MNGIEDGKDQAGDAESGATAAAKDVLHPAIPPGAAAIIAETDPRLNQLSETEEELKELVDSNEAAEAEGVSEDTSESDPS
jgi:hypothetical protein